MSGKKPGKLWRLYYTYETLNEIVKFISYIDSRFGRNSKVDVSSKKPAAYSIVTKREPAKLRPEEWQILLGVIVRDPDGWRAAKKSWDEPVTREEFEELLVGCTIEDVKNRPR